MRFADNETLKQALREAIATRQRDLEQFVMQLRQIEQEERDAHETMLRSMQSYEDRNFSGQGEK